MTPRLRPALLLVAALSALVGLAFLLLPPALGGVPATPVPSDGKPVLPRLDPPDSTLAEALVLANAFSARRAPPTTRYAPPEGSLDSSGGMLADPLGGDTTAVSDAAPLLLGTVVGTRGRMALLQLDPFAGAPRLYAEGERDGGYRILSIAPRAVVLAGPRGRLTLRLDPQEERP
jgi:hypothetical protein